MYNDLIDISQYITITFDNQYITLYIYIIVYRYNTILYRTWSVCKTMDTHGYPVWLAVSSPLQRYHTINPKNDIENRKLSLKEFEILRKHSHDSTSGVQSYHVLPAFADQMVRFRERVRIGSPKHQLWSYWY